MWCLFMLIQAVFLVSITMAGFEDFDVSSLDDEAAAAAQPSLSERSSRTMTRLCHE